MILFICIPFASATVEDQCVEAINSYRKENGVEPFNRNSALDAAAKIQAEHECNIGECTHDGPAGNESFTDRIANSNYNQSTGAENVAQGNGEDANQAFEMWKDSPGHNANMLSPDYADTGMACCLAGDGNSYWANVFASGSGGETIQSGGGEAKKDTGASDSVDKPQEAPAEKPQEAPEEAPQTIIESHENEEEDSEPEEESPQKDSKPPSNERPPQENKKKPAENTEKVLKRTPSGRIVIIRLIKNKRKRKQKSNKNKPRRTCPCCGSNV